MSNRKKEIHDFFKSIGFENKSGNRFEIIITSGEDEGDVLIYEITGIHESSTQFNGVTSTTSIIVDMEYYGIVSPGKPYDYVCSNISFNCTNGIDEIISHIQKRRVFKDIIRSKKLKELGI